MRLDRTGFPPAPRAPLRSAPQYAPRIEKICSGVLEINARGGMTDRSYARSPVTASSLHFGSMTIEYVRISCGGNHGQSTLRTEPHRTHSVSYTHLTLPTNREL